MAENTTQSLSSVDRALTLMEVLGNEGPLTLTQLMERMEGGKTTLFRLAKSLVMRGWLIKGDDFSYSIGPAAIALAARCSDVLDFNRIIEPIMIELQAETQETIHMTRLEGRFVVYTNQILSPKAVVSRAVLGGRSPAHCVSPGLALLAASKDHRVDWVLRAPLTQFTENSPITKEAVKAEIQLTRERGYAVNVGMYRQDVGGVGVAICASHGAPIAGLSLCAPVFRLKEMDLQALGKRLVRAARDAETALSLARNSSD